MSAIRTANLTGVALDWAVAKCEHPGRNCRVESYATNPPKAVACWLVVDGKPDFSNPPYSPSTDWSQGGPIIERERIELSFWASDAVWHAQTTQHLKYTEEGEFIDGTQYPQDGPAPLVAAMRCYVVSKLGDEVDVPLKLAAS